MKPKLLISFSGGKTSAYMANRLIREDGHRWDIVVAFANTGQEHNKTLDYVHKCDLQYGLDVVWLEAVFDPMKGKGTRHKIVTYETATRRKECGGPFEDMIKKHGLPNSQFPHCTRELKLYPIRSYLKSIGWNKRHYVMAIGIRADEFDRISARAKEDRIIYPLVGWGVTKPMVLAWEAIQPVRLGIPEHFGNCSWCWKKSYRKLATVANEDPEAFAFPAMVEAKYPDAGPGFGGRKMFRGRKTVQDIFSLAKEPCFEPYVDGFDYRDERLDVGAACGESCEIGADE